MDSKFIRLVKKNIIAIFICFITFLGGFWFFLASDGDSIKVRLLISIIGFIPFFVFSIITWFVFHFSNKEKVRSELLKFMYVLGIYYVFAITICAFIEVDNPVTDIGSYKAKVNDERLLKAFPKSVPDDVREVHFVYAPGILQGGTEIALYYIDDNFDLEKFDKKYKDKAIWIGFKNDFVLESGLLSSAFSNTPVEFENEDDFIIYLIEGKCDNSGYCNHGEFLFVAVNEDTNEVVYKSESW